MKKSIKILGAFSFLLCFACGANKNTQSKMEEAQQEATAERTYNGDTETSPEGNSIEKDAATETTDAMADMKDNNASNTENVPVASLPSDTTDSMESSKMYSQLKMTDLQIKNLENRIQEFKVRQKNTANGEMLGTVDSEKGRILKEILSPEQYKAYQSLKK